MAYVDQSSDFGYGTDLTSIQMQNLRDNMHEISQTMLKTSTGEVVVYNNDPSAGAGHNSTAAAHLLLPGGEYGFYPQTKAEQSSWGSVYSIAPDADLSAVNSSTYQSLVYLVSAQGSHALGTQNSTSTWAQQRYVTSSGEVFWIFLLRDKETKNIVASWVSPDHPCFGNSNDPNKVQHPFPGHDSDKYEIVVINPTTDEIQKIDDLRNYTYGMPHKSFTAAMTENYDIDEVAGVKWPSRKVTVGLNRDRTSSIKVKIPKPENIKQAKLVKK